MTTLSTKPYFVRALYEWCNDSGHTPHLVAWVNEHTQVPMQYVRDHEIVLNIGPNACQGLVIDSDWVHFQARFAGVAHDIWIPIGHVISIFARESGEGMGFEVEPWVPSASLKLAEEVDASALEAENKPAAKAGKTGSSSRVQDETNQAAKAADNGDQPKRSAKSPASGKAKAKKGLKLIK